jgi:hypothetical protein
LFDWAALKNGTDIIRGPSERSDTIVGSDTATEL